MKNRVLLFALIVALLITGSTNQADTSSGTSQDGKQNTRTRNAQKQQDSEEGEVLKVGTELVTVPFSVTNKQNRYITDVKQEEVAVFEDGKQQELFSFTRETDLPLTFVILLDISGSQELTLPSQKEAAINFLEKVIRPEKDLAAVVTFRKDVEMLQGLTANIRQIRTALDSIRFTPGSASVSGTPPLGGSAYAGTSLYDAIYVTTDELLAKEAGRRVIIMLTDGRDTTSSYSRQKAIERAWRSEVLVYSIGIEGRGQYGGQVFTEDVDKKTLQTICEETGGRLFLPKSESEYQNAFRQIEDDLRQQYILAYTPSNDTTDGAFRTITVKLNRKDSREVKVLHRRGYYTKKGV
ncbi:MAG: VWA domain-containing protein [Blastocatellia bacterium]|nr:VWA domain-containing protein [Blastocatellia bacterium]